MLIPLQNLDLTPRPLPPPLASGDTLAQAVDFVPLLLQTVEKAAAQNSQQALLAEGVAAAMLLSCLALLETQTGEGRRATPQVPDGFQAFETCESSSSFWPRLH